MNFQEISQERFFFFHKTMSIPTEINPSPEPVHLMALMFVACTRIAVWLQQKEPSELCENTPIRLSEEAATSPDDSTDGDHETAETSPEPSEESSITCRKKGSTGLSLFSEGDGK